MAVCLGPSDPTYLVDHLLAKCCPAICGRNFEIQGDLEEEESGESPDPDDEDDDDYEDSQDDKGRN